MASILIVDDAAFMRRIVKDILIDLGHSVVGEAVDGGDAVQKYEALRPDIVLMDITMPDLNGIEGLRRIRQINPSAKVIMCTAMSQEFYPRLWES